MMIRIVTVGLSLGLAAGAASAQSTAWMERDRGGDGIPLSMFATYVRGGDVVFYPFFEHYRDGDLEYEAGELGYVGTTERFGRYRANEGLIFLGYGISSRWAVELEAAVISARLEKDPRDTSAMPSVLEQSGLGDVEGQVRYRWTPDTDGGGELFSYFETVLPLQRKKLLIGTPDWEFKLGTGYMRSFAVGTFVVRGAVGYAEALELGEYAVEYIRGVSRHLRLYTGFEGSEDEVELITEAQLRFGAGLVLKLNSAFGVTPKATDWAPEVGLVFRF